MDTEHETTEPFAHTTTIKTNAIAPVNKLGETSEDDNLVLAKT